MPNNEIIFRSDDSNSCDISITASKKNTVCDSGTLNLFCKYAHCINYLVKSNVRFSILMCGMTIIMIKQNCQAKKYMNWGCTSYSCH